MLDNNTISKLLDMKMGVMASEFRNQLSKLDFREMSFEERMGLMVDSVHCYAMRPLGGGLLAATCRVDCSPE